MATAQRQQCASVRASCRALTFLVGAVLACSAQLHAGAWTQDAGHGQIIFTSSFLQTSDQFDSSGASRPFGYNGRFRQLAFNPYLEYGLSRRYTLVLNLNAPLLKYSNQYGATSSAGLGDVEVGIRRRLNSTESAWAISGQISAQFPAYSATRNPAPGNHQGDVETRLLVGRGATWAQHHVFWDAEAAYRYRSGPPADEFRSDFTSGINLTARFMAMGQMFVIKSLRNGDPFTTTNPNAQSDFDLYKAQVSLVTALGRGTRIQLGWNDAFAGRNTGGGHTATLGIWKSF
jgi:hypothetical protein